jgi:outer membrane translocation and assembly module TamA
VDRLSRSNNPKTTFSAAFNFQRRPDYERTLSRFRWRYRFQETKFKTHIIDPVEFSIIRINKSQFFEDRLNAINDQFLLTSYQDHLISASAYTFVYNNQEFKFQRRHMLNSASVEFAGSLLRLLHDQLGAERGEDGGYRMFDIRFAQYLKIEDDLRFYRNYDDKNTVVFRINGGLGLPLSNLDVLPFDRSFFTGGSTGIRSWQARTLGPGSFRDSTAAVTFNNIGEIKIEANIEYRFSMTSLLNGAFFIDAGNIWLLEEDEIRPGSGFEAGRFLSEMAIGAGFGLRFDFDFFLIRLDAGIQLKDPAKKPGERWIWEPKDEYNEYLRSINPENPRTYLPRVVFNIGIGYPF